MSILASYGFFGSFQLAVDVVRTYVWFPGARLIRFPIFVRGRRWIDFGKSFSAGRGLRIEAFGERDIKSHLIKIGRDVRVNDYVHIGATRGVTIGDRVLIASKVFISDHNHGTYRGSGPQSSPEVSPQDRVLYEAKIVIEDDVWLGESVAVLPGVRIGRGSIIGALTTVTRDIPCYCIAVGSPARVIKRYNFESATWEAV